MSLTEELRKVPDDVFWRKNPRGEFVPAFNATFGWLMRQSKAYSKGDAESIVDAVERGMEIPNISTFQREMAKEAGRRQRLHATP